MLDESNEAGKILISSTFKLLVCGCDTIAIPPPNTGHRDLDLLSRKQYDLDRELIRSKLGRALSKVKESITVIANSKRPIGAVAKSYAIDKGYRFVDHSGTWGYSGQESDDEGDVLLEVASCVIIFWDGQSTTTLALIDKTRRMMLPYKIYVSERPGNKEPIKDEQDLGCMGWPNG